VKLEIELKGKALAAAALLGAGGLLAAVSVLRSPAGLGPVSPEAIVSAMISENDHVQPLELARWILEKRGDYQLIDLRDPWQYDDYHIPTAINIPLGQLFTGEGLERLERGKKIVVYGLGAGHPAQAQLLLSLKGYPAYSLKEGIAAWWDQVMTPQSLRGENPQPEGYRQARALRERFLAGAAQPPAAAAPGAPQALPAAPPPQAPPKRLRLGRGCS
jgi:rhodanese-related sulfurtransferase